jgi:hypothetical protein
MKLIEWLNQNQGFALIALTFVYVIATIVMAYLMIQSNNLNAKNIAQALKIEKDRTRPYVMFDLRFEGWDVYAILKNYGATPALNVKVDIKPELTNTLRHSPAPCLLTTQIYSYLAPEKEMVESINGSPNFWDLYKEPKFTGRITYQDTNGEKYEDALAVNLPRPDGTAIIFSDGEKIANELKELKDAVKDLKDSVRDFERNQRQR